MSDMFDPREFQDTVDAQRKKDAERARECEAIVAALAECNEPLAEDGVYPLWLRARKLKGGA